jgi:hypothetical protein
MTRAEKRRFVHLGDRLQAIARIRAGTSDAHAIAEELGVTMDEVAHWLQVHREERNVTLEELREQATPEVLKLRRRAARLADLVAQAERMLRELHQELTSKQFGENPHLRALRVVHAQPRGD